MLHKAAAAAAATRTFLVERTMAVTVLTSKVSRDQNHQPWLKISLNQAEGRAAWRKLSTWRRNLEKLLYGLVSFSGTRAGKWMTCKKHQKALQSHWNLNAGIPVFDSPWNLQLRDHPAPIQCICRSGWEHLAPVMLTESIQWLTVWDQGILDDWVKLIILNQPQYQPPAEKHGRMLDAWWCVQNLPKSIKICQVSQRWTLKLGVHAEVPSRNGWNAGTATIARQGIQYTF